MNRRQGFTLVEFLVATSIVLAATALAVWLVAPVNGALSSLPESTDVLQRVRVVADALRTDLAAAGSGPSTGWGSTATVTWPAVMPCRWTGGALGSLAGGCARSDSVTVVSVAINAPQAIVPASVADQASPLAVAAATACSLDRTACKFHAGALVLLQDGTGAWDLSSVTTVSSDGGMLTMARRASAAYAAGAMVAEAGARAYFQAVESGTGIPQLRRADDGGNSFPVADHVVSLAFEYFGVPGPPALVESDDGVERAVSYGPLPPRPSIDNPLDAWPAGENCTFALANGTQVSRLATLAADGSGLAPLSMPRFADGPWCPDDTSANRFDADLLRIRLVRVTIRAQAQSSAARGSSATWFARPGQGRDALRLVPDVSVSFDVALPGMWR